MVEVCASRASTSDVLPAPDGPTSATLRTRAGSVAISRAPSAPADPDLTAPAALPDMLDHLRDAASTSRAPPRCARPVPRRPAPAPGTPCAPSHTRAPKVTTPGRLP